MDVLTFYSIGFSAMWALPLLPGIYALFRRYAVPLLRRQLARFRYQRISGLTRLHLFRGATCVELLFLSAYIAGNGVAVALEAIEGTTIASSAALAASINLVPLLLGGRTSRVADVIGISRPAYYAAHHWIGRTAIVEGLVHAAIGLNAVTQGQAFDPIAASGCMAAGSFLAVFLLSLPWLRRTLGAAFHSVHRILYLAGMAGLIWHVLLTQSVLHEILVFVACGLWFLSHVYRVVARWRSAVVTGKWSDSEVTRLRLRTQRPVAAFPGSYFYLYLPGSYLNYDLLRSSAVMMLWSDVEQAVTGKTTDFCILAGRQSRYLRQLRTIETGDRMLLDGPYGQDLQLYGYETVILTAKGVGIVSVLPMALHLAARKAYDDSVRSRSNLDEDPTVGLTAPPAAATVFRDATRRIDLLWRLEHNDQDQWVADQLRALQDLDPRRVMLLVWCIYPKPQARDPPFQEEPHWVAVYPAGGQTMAEAEAPYSFEKALSHEVLMPGKCIVVACGDRAFTDERRASVIRNTSRDWPIEFVEAEYRPRHNEHRPGHGRGRPRHGEGQTRHPSRLRRRDRPADRIQSWSSNAPLMV
ncbi:hypothetical protein C8A01DRAFT_18612 [Parachaetomium inaequale]|uniref:Ferric oxidoreductase domain-containing protein n=1 Tax=Parachaetomium inaequale TaxID=2588326 RepID=A0AAN6SPA8_9PEZI|nr:hypothetical protein C8A01DRAFT_18612 [Parachaetomium inaequale]